jgi:hypothetical protein
LSSAFDIGQLPESDGAALIELIVRC